MVYAYVFLIPLVSFGLNWRIVRLMSWLTILDCAGLYLSALTRTRLDWTQLDCTVLDSTWVQTQTTSLFDAEGGSGGTNDSRIGGMKEWRNERMSKVDYGLNGIIVSMILVLVLDDIVRPCRLYYSYNTILTCSTCTSKSLLPHRYVIPNHYFHIDTPKSIPLQRYIDAYTSHQSSKVPLHLYV